jgi:hypothetical protein
MRRVAALVLASSSVIMLSSAFLSGCQEKPKYKPEGAYSGAKASVPKVPQIPATSTFKDGANWTVYGIQHHLLSPRHRNEVEMKPASVQGYVIDVYKPVEPKGKEGCIYPTKAHPPTSKEPTPKGIDCADVVKSIEPPHFWIADSKDEKSKAKAIVVMGYTSTYIQQFMAKDEYKKKNKKPSELKEDDLYMDNNYSAKITILGEPKVGAKVVATGLFGTKYEEGSGGRRVEPYGIVDITSNKKGKLEYKEGEEVEIDVR